MHVTCSAVDCPWPLEEDYNVTHAILEDRDLPIRPETFFRGRRFAANSLYYGVLPILLPWACRPLPNGVIKISTWNIPKRWLILAAASVLLLLASFGYLLTSHRHETQILDAPAPPTIWDSYLEDDVDDKTANFLTHEVPAHVTSCSAASYGSHITLPQASSPWELASRQDGQASGGLGHANERLTQCRCVCPRRCWHAIQSHSSYRLPI